MAEKQDQDALTIKDDGDRHQIGVDYLSSIPAELMEMILDHMSFRDMVQLSGTSKGYHERITSDPRRWRKIAIRNLEGQLMPIEVLRQFVKHSRGMLATLSLDANVMDQNEILELIAGPCSQIKTLELWVYRNQDNTTTDNFENPFGRTLAVIQVQHIIRKCTALQTLKLGLVSFEHCSANDLYQYPPSLSPCTPQLRSLELTFEDCPYSTGSDSGFILAALCSDTPLLRDLKLGYGLAPASLKHPDLSSSFASSSPFRSQLQQNYLVQERAAGKFLPQQLVTLELTFKITKFHDKLFCLDSFGTFNHSTNCQRSGLTNLKSLVLEVEGGYHSSRCDFYMREVAFILLGRHEGGVAATTKLSNLEIQAPIFARMWQWILSHPRLRQLRALSVRQLQNIDADFIKEVHAQMGGLETLDLRGSIVETNAFRALAKLPSLHEVDARGCAVYHINHQALSLPTDPRTITQIVKDLHHDHGISVKYD